MFNRVLCIIFMLSGSLGFIRSAQMDLDQALPGAPEVQSVCHVCCGESSTILFSCGHSNCCFCLNMLLDSALKHKKSVGLKCQESSCGKPVESEDLRLFCSDVQKISNFQDIQVLDWLATQGNAKYCPVPDCPNIFLDEGACSRTVNCDGCQKSYCSECLMDHSEDVLCEDKKMSEMSLEERANDELKTKVTKSCPSCSVAIEKSFGCDWMKCQKCEHEFCWQCLKPHDHNMGNHMCMQLLVAVQRQDVDKVKSLLEQGAFVDVVDMHGDAILSLAIKFGNLEIFKALLDKGANVELSSNKFKTRPINYAFAFGRKEMIEILLDIKPELLAVGNLVNIRYAVSSNNRDVLDLILSKSPDLINVSDKTGSKLVHLATRLGKQESLDVLLGKDEKLIKAVDLYKKQPIHYAVEFAKINIFKKLLDLDGSLISAADSCGSQPIHYSIKFGKKNIFDEILEKNPELVNSKDMFDKTSIHYAIQFGRTAIFVELLEKFPQLIKAKDNSGKEPIHYAALFGRKDMFVRLLKLDPNLVNSKEKLTNKPIVYVLAQESKISQADRAIMVNAIKQALELVNLSGQKREGQESDLVDRPNKESRS